MRGAFRTVFVAAVAAVLVMAVAQAAGARGYLVTASWGVAGSAPGELATPKGAAVDAAGFVYVVDYGNDTVIKFTPNGQIATVWGGHGAAKGLFDHPSRLALGPDGSVYVTDAGNDRIQRFSPDGSLIRAWGTRGVGPGQFVHPRGIAVSADGTVYVTDQGNARVQVFSGGGRFLRGWGARGSGRGCFNAPKDVAVGTGGRVYVVDAVDDRIQVFTSGGRWLAAWGGHGSAPGRFSGPRGVAVDGRGHLFVADAMNDRIQEFRADGSFVRLWGCRGREAGLLLQPRDVAPAPDGSVVVVDTYNRRLQRYALSDSGDGDPPRTSCSLRSGWRRTPVTATLTAVDAGSGVAVTYALRSPAAEFTAVAEPWRLESQGTHRARYLSVDAAGNQESIRELTVRLDWTDPEVVPDRLAGVRTSAGRAATVRFSVADRYSPACHMTLAVTRDGRVIYARDLGWRGVSPSGRAQRVEIGARLAPARYGLTLTVRDRAGNSWEGDGALVVL